MDKVKKTVSASEEDKVSRKLLVWLNTYPDLPVDLIRFESLPADTSAMAISTIQASYIVKRYVLGAPKRNTNSKSFTGLSRATAWINGCQRMKR